MRDYADLRELDIGREFVTLEYHDSAVSIADQDILAAGEASLVDRDTAEILIRKYDVPDRF